MSADNIRAMSDISFEQERRKPDDPRQNMEPSDMSPSDARKFIHDLVTAASTRVQAMDSDKFNKPDGYRTLPPREKAKQYYGSDKINLLTGIRSALREWDESGEQTKELKEDYGGTFVEGVEIGERLAVYQGTDFTFTESSSASEEESESKFTFTE